MNQLQNNKTILMGVLNITPDSFYSGNKFLNSVDDIDHLDLSYADIIDIGAESSRPYSTPISIENEISRLSEFDKTSFENKILSIDSYKYDVINYALENGFNMINDISAGGQDNKNFDLSIKYNVPIVIMHMRGNPATMQNNLIYDNIIDDLLIFFDERINSAISKGISLDNIIIDPGIGFGKTKDDNFKIIKNINKLKRFGAKVLIGISRKSFLELDNDKPEDRLETSLSALSIAVYNGVDIVRVHDIYKTYKVVNIIDRIKNQS